MLNGWWPEACQHGVNGWAIGNGEKAAPNQDQRDLEALYATLEGDVLPAFGNRERWLGMMQASIATAEGRFSSDRMVREYFGRLYGSD